MKTETFTKFDYQLIKEGYSTNQTLIICYLKSFQEQNKYCFQSKLEIAKLFGIPETTFKREIKALIEKGTIFISQDKKYLKAAFNNRKVLILVDDNNPLPTAEPTKLVAEQIETTKDIPTIEKIKESLPQQTKVVEEISIPQLEPKFKLPSNLTSKYWEDGENLLWLQQYMLDGYKIEGVLEANLKIRLENYKDRLYNYNSNF